MAACKKEKAAVQDTAVLDNTVHCSDGADSVFSFPVSEGGGGGYYPSTLYLSNDTLWKYPCFNPNNENEISYVQQIPNGTSTLMKYNLQTSEKTIVRENLSVAQQPVWCMNGWSYFMGYGQNMVRVNMTTGELHQMTTLNKDRYITSNIKTGEFIFTRFISSSVMYGIKANATGEQFDTVSVNPNGDWRDNLLAGGERYSGIATCEIGSEQVESLHQFPVNLGYIINDVKIHPNNRDVYATCWYIDGLYKVNRDTKQLTLVKDGNNNCWYDTFSISQNGHDIIFEKVICNIGLGDVVYSKSEIWMMNINGCNERKVYL
jgi:hypothetical protein